MLSGCLAAESIFKELQNAGDDAESKYKF